MNEGINVEGFTPRDKKYKTVKDLPPESQEYFKSTSDKKGFLLASVLQFDSFDFFEEFDKKLPLTEQEFEERIQEKIREKIRSAGLLEKMNLMLKSAYYENNKEGRFSPGELRKEVQEEVLVEAMEEIALLANEGLTKYPDMHFEKQSIQPLMFRVGNQEFKVGDINPIVLKGSMILENGEKHEVECIYANIKLRRGNYMGEQYEVPKLETGRKLVQVYVDGKHVFDSIGEQLAEKIYTPVIMRDQYIPSQKSTRFPGEYADELAGVLSSIEYRMQCTQERLLEEAEKIKTSEKIPSTSEIARELIEI